MKKYIKLLLLGGIFTLIGIFNFSSAYVYETVVEGVFDNVGGNQISVISINPSKPYQPHNFNSSAVSLCLDLSFNNLNWAGLGANPDYIYFNSDLCIPNSSFDGTFYNIQINGGTSGPSSYKLYYVLPDPPIIEGGTSTFTPIITGLTNSVNEFIPYVAYIGIGLLTAVIGFVAIKRLINWVRAKIFSSFKR